LKSSQKQKLFFFFSKIEWTHVAFETLVLKFE